jgi:hypothetical protein
LLITHLDLCCRVPSDICPVIFEIQLPHCCCHYCFQFRFFWTLCGQFLQFHVSFYFLNSLQFQMQLSQNRSLFSQLLSPGRPFCCGPFLVLITGWSILDHSMNTLFISGQYAKVYNKEIFYFRKGRVNSFLTFMNLRKKALSAKQKYQHQYLSTHTICVLLITRFQFINNHILISNLYCRNYMHETATKKFMLILQLSFCDFLSSELAHVLPPTSWQGK